jgi:hypothetical protein
VIVVVVVVEEEVQCRRYPVARVQPDKSLILELMTKPANIKKRVARMTLAAYAIPYDDMPCRFVLFFEFCVVSLCVVP